MVILFWDFLDVIFVVCFGSFLVIGVGDGEYFVVSDVLLLVGYIDKIIYFVDY